MLLKLVDPVLILINMGPSNVIYITILGLGLIKINTVSANFNNPRPLLVFTRP